MALICLVGVNIPAEANEPILRQISVGYWDIWRHADGITWQETGKPGDTKEYTFQPTVPAKMEGYKNIEFKIKPIIYISEQEYTQYGGRAGTSYPQFRLDILQYLPQNYQKKDDKTVTFKLDGKYFDIKKDWQGQQVEGRRYYLPVLVEWYGEEGLQKPVDLVASFVTRTEEAVPNKNLTYKAKLINPSGTEQNTDYVWRIDGKTYGPYKITLAPNSSQIVTRSIKTTQGFHEIEVEVNPSQNKPANEVRYCNNKDFVYLIVNYPDLPEAEPGSGLRPPGLAG